MLSQMFGRKSWIKKKYIYNYTHYGSVWEIISKQKFGDYGIEYQIWLVGFLSSFLVRITATRVHCNLWTTSDSYNCYQILISRKTFVCRGGEADQCRQDAFVNTAWLMINGILPVAKTALPLVSVQTATKLRLVPSLWSVKNMRVGCSLFLSWASRERVGYVEM